jgi:hypothetical protein
MSAFSVAKFWRIQVLLSLFLVAFSTASIAVGTGQQAPKGKTLCFMFSKPTNSYLDIDQLVYEPENQNVVHLPHASVSPQFVPNPSHTPSANPPVPPPTYSATKANTLRELHAALSTMQDHYFAVWLGKYTTAIDWTAAVMSTYVSATLSTLSRSLSYTMPGTFDKSRKLDVEAQMVENEINKYFAQTTSYYFGEDHFAIRMQAFDDMLWVVLGWLESTQFIESHSVGHYKSSSGLGGGKDWHASQFIPAFAHRARVFYELAERGWDWRLCGGGMTWNPRLLPYKNAITNQLFISASISMYLHFPGDENCSPFLSQYDKAMPHMADLDDACDENRRGRYDPVYLANAINGYEWLKNSGMTNELGLYTDGFHIRDYPSSTRCNERNEMVYTYNQGVILSGLRGLWEATGKTSYLEDGHELIRNVIRATGWTSASQQDPQKTTHNDHAPFSWAGLGSNGILTELCDPSAHCSQDSQTFKGIFFHHLTSFCAPLPTRPTRPGKTHAAPRETAMLHAQSCTEYLPWVSHNAVSALATRDKQGRFGAWWGAAYRSSSMDVQYGDGNTDIVVVPIRAVDYRNTRRMNPHTDDDDVYVEYNATNPSFIPHSHGSNTRTSSSSSSAEANDVNDRGRGRTVETQGSGLAVVRAMWEFRRWYGEDGV